ncbi:(d)CMP kinase [Candidatus Oleimmundimicrobium sp.]|uniref:(d)CMP kinase n=1 Tax=Candidatus Oleimmundimicrobium sp. TaxID=3060597 RepID=UPI00271C216D|nr:(d)CMP kinase [Candidatus Oleimmundimicrobium sp.]MDO8885301.1 (d)CMP kinase [Candidatus Oleimmundimicrobium sp.]
MIIAIDGPAASGKSTVAKEIAKRLSLYYLDTGAMYRALTWKALQEKINLSDEAALVKLANNVKISFKEDFVNEKLQVKTYLDGCDVTDEIRLPQVSNCVSIIAKVPALRRVMVEIQRRMAKGKDVVVEGRDIGTCVFPEADYKFFLNASAKKRARRRYLELKSKGHDVEISSLEKEIVSRDTIDSTRPTSPLAKACDAYVIDTTKKTIEQVIQEILRIVGDES